jgi:hypothetical protein
MLHPILSKHETAFEYSPTLFRALTALKRLTILLLLAFGVFAVMRQARDTKRDDAKLSDDQAHSVSKMTLEPFRAAFLQIRLDYDLGE